MKWIKLIDKKPETWHLKPVRFIHTKMPILDIEKLLAERPNSTLSIVEWLDESTPSPSIGFTEDEMQLCFGYAFGLGQGGMVELKDVRTWYEKFLASLPQSKVEGEDWVSVEDELPEMGKPVACWHSTQLVPFVGFYNGYWSAITAHVHTNDDNYIKLVPGAITHWRYLPAQPKQ